MAPGGLIITLPRKIGRGPRGAVTMWGPGGVGLAGTWGEGGAVCPELLCSRGAGCLKDPAGVGGGGAELETQGSQSSSLFEAQQPPSLQETEPQLPPQAGSGLIPHQYQPLCKVQTGTGMAVSLPSSSQVPLRSGLSKHTRCCLMQTLTPGQSTPGGEGQRRAVRKNILTVRKESAPKAGRRGALLMAKS